MKALFATGRPEALVGFGQAEVPRPCPDEALVRVDALSVNRGEMLLLEERDRAGGQERTSPGSSKRPQRMAPARPPAGG